VSFLTDFENRINTTFTTLIAPAQGNILGFFQAIFIAGMSIWILLIAYEVAWGKSEDGLTFALTKIFRVWIIGLIAIWGWPAIQELVVNVKDGLVLSLGGSSTIGTVLDNNLINPMRALWRDIADQAVLGMMTLSIFSLGAALATILSVVTMFLAYLVMVVVVAALGVVTMAMFMVSLSVFYMLLAVGPFFLMCLAFPFLQRFFESWAGAAMTAALAMAFTALLATFAPLVLGITGFNAAAAANAANMVNNGTYGFAIDMLGQAGMCLLLIYMYFKVFDLASALGGGLSLGNNMIGAMRTLSRDALRGQSRPSSSPRVSNTLSQGRSGGGNATSAAARPSRALEAIAANRSMTGMAVTALGHGSSAAGRFAYNRGAAAMRVLRRAG
jgi:type IV secretion system protein VirB6